MCITAATFSYYLSKKFGDIVLLLCPIAYQSRPLLSLIVWFIVLFSTLLFRPEKALCFMVTQTQRYCFERVSFWL